MIELMCSVGLLTGIDCINRTPIFHYQEVTLVRTYAPAPRVPSAITFVQHPNSTTVDVVYPPHFYPYYAPVLHDPQN